MRGKQMEYRNHKNFIITDARKKEFRKPFGMDAHPSTPSKKECLEVIHQGLLDDNHKLRDLKDLLNIVKRWTNNNSELDEAMKQELDTRFKAAHDVWSYTQYIRFWGISNAFRDTAQRFLEYARDNIPPEIALGDTLGKNEPNQDTFFIDHQHRSFAVFDGVGGAADGHIASTIARDFIQKQLTTLSDDISIEKAKKEIRKILLDTDKKIREKNLNSNMATTASVVKIMKDGTAVIGNAGDSRVYLLEGVKSKSQPLIHLTLDNDISNDPNNKNPGSDSINMPDMPDMWDIQKRIANLETFTEPPEDLQTFIKYRNLADNVLVGQLAIRRRLGVN